MRLDRLPPDVLTAFERDVLDDPRVTAEQARQWLAERGFPFSLGPVVHYRNKRARRRETAARAAAVRRRVEELARARGLTQHDLVAGAALRAERDLFQRLRGLMEGLSSDPTSVKPDEMGVLIQALRVQVAARAAAKPSAQRMRTGV